MSPEQIAEVCHEANRAVTRHLADVPTQPPWDACGLDMRGACIAGVRFALENPSAPPSASHDAWMKGRLAAGWRLGPVRSDERKEHPALVPYGDLPEAVRRKDVLFRAIVAALKP